MCKSYMVLVNSLFCKTAKLLATDTPTKMLKALVTVSNLTCSRGERLLFDQLSFEIESGDCLHIIGSNGSGKTTLLRTLAGLNIQDDGSFEFSVQEQKIKKSLYLGHLDALKGELSCIENLRYFQLEHSSNNETVLDQILAKMGILDCADLMVSSLSFGQRRRLAFARLLVTQSLLWILDEPFTGIDHDGRELIELLCVEHLQNHGSILLSNHHSLQASSLAPHLKELNLQ